MQVVLSSIGHGEHFVSCYNYGVVTVDTCLIRYGAYCRVLAVVLSTITTYSSLASHAAGRNLH